MDEVYSLFGTSHMPHMKKLIINVALTGNFSSKSENPAVPYTPDEIADDVSKCFGAGARFFHIHARDEGGKPTCRKEAFGEILAKVRKKCPEAILCATTSGRIFKSFEERSGVLELEGEAKPDFASLSLGSMNFPTEPSVNSPEMIERLARKMAEKNILPELEVFETGMLNYGSYLMRKGKFSAPPYFNLFFGLLGTMPGRMIDICHQVHSVPPGAVWGAAGGGRFQLPVNTAAILMGGHVRVGLEDNLFYDAAKTAPATNEMLVQRVARLAGEIGRPIAGPDEARKMLGLTSSG
ncbi:MAG TPA: 3-keto-5-aminohexanoate cleavage protein [Candidatus Bilamarchaeum sp.]|nr:3-keto-5-aminohexanoate cleavage protein [Candidatus Bilamarchaeum sp.]